MEPPNRINLTIQVEIEQENKKMRNNNSVLAV